MVREDLADGTTTWKRRWRIGRLQLGFRVHRHSHLRLPDRWVFHPELVYDRKSKGAVDARR